MRQESLAKPWVLLNSDSRAEGFFAMFVEMCHETLEQMLVLLKSRSRSAGF